MSEPQYHRTILQTCVPAYRVPVFAALAARLPNFRVLAGERYFYEGLETVANDEPWFSGCENRFLFRNKFCWQKNVVNDLQADQALIAEFNPRILSTWRLFQARRRLGRRSLFWGHLRGLGKRPRVLRFIRNRMLQIADGLVVYTETDAKELQAEGYKKPIWVTQNSCLSEADCRPVGGKQTDFIYVGRLVKNKKVDLLIRAFARLAAAQQSAALHVVGGGPELEDLQSIAKTQNIQHRVRFWGSVSNTAKLREVYSNCLAAVSPGYVGLSAIQAMGNGIPILVADNEPHAPEIEACQDGRTALFFESDSEEALVDSMKVVLHQKEHWKQRRQDIASFIRSTYTMEHMARVLQDALAGENQFVFQPTTETN